MLQDLLSDLVLILQRTRLVHGGLDVLGAAGGCSGRGRCRRRGAIAGGGRSRVAAGRRAGDLTWRAPGDMEHVRSPGGVTAGMSAATEEGCPNSWTEFVREKGETGGHGGDQIRMVVRLTFTRAASARTALSAARERRERER